MEGIIFGWQTWVLNGDVRKQRVSLWGHRISKAMKFVQIRIWGERLWN